MKLAFAIPGDRHRRTGGFIYESTVLDQLRGLGHEVEHLQLPDAFPGPTPEDVAETLRLLQTLPPDVPLILDGFIPGCAGPGVLAHVTAPLVPIIHHPLGLETGLPPQEAGRLIDSEREALRHAAHIIVPSPHTAQILTERFDVPEDKLTIATPGFDGAPLPSAPADPPLILAVGLLAERKGHDVLIDALAQVVDLDWQARIVGGTHDPKVAAALRSQVDQLGLANRVTFTGPLDDRAVAEAFAAASIFAMATRYEGYGIVFGEAMRAGLPIVTCDGGAVRDTVGPAGHVGPVDDVETFAAALRRLLTEPAHYRTLAQASRNRGQSLPSWRDTAGAIADAVAAHVTG